MEPLIRRPDDMPDPLEIERLVEELDRELDACFLEEIAPALAKLPRDPRFPPSP